MLTGLHHVQAACPAGSEHAEIHCGVEADLRPARKAHPGLHTADLDALADAREATGHPVEWDPHFPRHRRRFVADPVGNRLELLEPLSEG